MRLPIEDSDLVIRSYEADDIAALTKYADNRAIADQLLDHFPHPYTEREARKWLRTAAKQKTEINFAIANSEELIGSIGLLLRADVYRHSAEVGYWLAEPFWGRGIATRALRVFSRWVFREFDFARLEARVYESNPASRRVLEKAGYTLEGRLRDSATKNGRLMDMFLYALLKHDVEGDREWNG